MSTRVDDTWVLGETWSEVITCTDEDGNALNPSSADYKLKALDGTIVAALTEASGIDIVVNVCTVTIPTTAQSGISSRVYRRRLKVTDSNGAISRQVHGLIAVLPAEDD